MLSTEGLPSSLLHQSTPVDSCTHLLASHERAMTTLAPPSADQSYAPSPPRYPLVAAPWPSRDPLVTPS